MAGLARKKMKDDDLKKALDDHGGDDVVIPYRDVAGIFPSNSPHPDSFDYNFIDEDRFLTWAKANDWSVTKIPEQAILKNSPPISLQKSNDV